MHLFSLSTSWNWRRHNNGYDLVKEIRSAGFDFIELNFALTKKIVDEVLSLKRSSEINITSLHNMCPLPPEIEPARASPDQYALSSCDDDERGRAVSIAKNTIDYAEALGAKAVVLHAGRVPVKDRMRDLAASFGNTTAFNELKDRMIAERSAKVGPYLDSTIKSLKELAPYAKKKKIFLAIENRYYHREIPAPDEFETIFRNFDKDDLCYWHDVGHAEVFERLGLARHQESLDKLATRLIGVHLHDIINLIDDHNAPGIGTFDFVRLKPYIKADTIKVIEVNQSADVAKIRSSVKYLKEIFG